MSVEEIGVGAAAFSHIDSGGGDGGELGAEDFFAAVAVAEAGPEVEFVGDAPAGAGVAAGFEGFAGGVGEVAREANMAAVDARVDARMDAVVDQLRREAAAAAEASEALAGVRYEEILRRLDRIERRLDTQ